MPDYQPLSIPEDEDETPFLSAPLSRQQTRLTRAQSRRGKGKHTVSDFGPSEEEGFWEDCTSEKREKAPLNIPYSNDVKTPPFIREIRQRISEGALEADLFRWSEFEISPPASSFGPDFKGSKLVEGKDVGGRRIAAVVVVYLYACGAV